MNRFLCSAPAEAGEVGRRRQLANLRGRTATRILGVWLIAELLIADC
jgi:hypothetical protein